MSARRASVALALAIVGVVLFALLQFAILRLLWRSFRLTGQPAGVVFWVMGMAMAERAGGRRWRSLVPGLAIAVVLHSAYNHFFVSPFVSALGIAVALPLILGAVFARSEAALGDWLGKGFDADAEMLSMIESGRLSDAPMGRYLHELKAKFEGPVVADLLCYVRLHTELALRAKGILMMRETGFDVLVVRSTKVGAEVFEAGDKLALVIRAGAGTNTIDTATAAARGVLVANLPGRNAIAVAELTMGLLLA